MESLLKQCAFDYIEPEAVAGTTTLTSDVLDMAGWDGVVFIALTGDATSGTVLTLQAYTHTANAASGSALTGAVATYTSASSSDADNKLLIVDVKRPINRYVYCTLARATQNCVNNGIIAIRYRGKSAPITQPSSVIASTLLVGV
jgi:hypothetical protein